MDKIVTKWGIDFVGVDGAWSILDDSDAGIKAMLEVCASMGLTSQEFWRVAPAILEQS